MFDETYLPENIDLKAFAEKKFSNEDNNSEKADEQTQSASSAERQVEEDPVEVTEEPLNVDINQGIYIGDIDEEIINDFTCSVCYGIVYNPIKCSGCGALYCKHCSGTKKNTRQRTKFECFMNCGSTSYNETLPRMETLVLNSLLFECQSEGCEDKIPLGQYMDHLQHQCKVLRYQTIFLPDGTTLELPKEDAEEQQ